MATNKETPSLGLDGFFTGEKSSDILERQCFPAAISKPNYQNYADRIATFATWPKSMPTTAHELAHAGFVYTGYGDKVHCPWCNLRLFDFTVQDIALEEHCRYTKECPYLRMTVPDQSKIKECFPRHKAVGFFANSSTPKPGLWRHESS